MSIADELALLANTKEGLRVSLELSKDVPFSRYAAYAAWHNASVPDSHGFLDFQNKRYSKSGVPCYLSDISEFIRLSAATMWQDGQLVEVGDNIPRISGDGLLIEKSSTELISNNSSLTSTSTAWTATQKTDAQIGNVFEFVSDGSSQIVTTNIPWHPNGTGPTSSGYYYRSILAKKSSTDSFLTLGSGGAFPSLIVNLKNGSIEYVGASHAESKISDIGEYYLIEALAIADDAIRRQFSFLASNNRGSGYTIGVPNIGHKVTVALPSFRDTADLPQSLVKTSGTRVTRSPDTLNIPLLPSQTITGDWDEGVTYEVADNIATFTGHGYIRNITVGAL